MPSRPGALLLHSDVIASFSSWMVNGVRPDDSWLSHGSFTFCAFVLLDCPVFV